MRLMIYLDNAATTFPKREEVYAEMDKVNRTLAVNAGRGSYKAAKEADLIISETRDRLVKLFHAEGIADTILTPSVTIALNEIIKGLSFTDADTVFVSPYEHNAVARALEVERKRVGFQVEFLPLRNDLTIDTEKLSYVFSMKRPAAVICSAISNVTGYILPVKEIFQAAKEYDAVTVLDAAQAAGLIDLDMDDIAADFICFAGHKTLGGPFGVGGFVMRKSAKLQVSLAGGTGSNSLVLEMPESAPGKYEAGSKDITAIAGLLASLKVLDVKEHEEKLSSLTTYLFDKLSDLDKVEIKGAYKEGESIGIVSFVVDGYTADEVGQILDDEFDIAVRTGYHCAPYIHKNLDDISYAGTIRVGLGLFNTEEDIDTLIEALETL